jgi:PPP family 3-phenylpropionic acid transporter
MALLSVAALAAALAMPAVPPAHEARPRLSDLGRLLRVRGIPQVLAAGALQWVCLAPYHGFFGEHVEHHGGGSFVVGASIAVAVAVEVLVMATAPRWLPRTTRRHVMAVSALAGVVRWSVTAYGSPGWIIAAQALHGLSYGAFYLAMVDAVARRAPPELRATAQALIASLAVGIGTLAGNVPAGALFGIDSGRTLFLAAAAFSVVPAIASLAIPPP